MHELGDPWSVLRLDDVPSPEPPAGAVRIAVGASDLNFADILQCQGTYQVKLTPPFTPGMGTAGTVVAVGEGVALTPGQKVVGPTLGPHGAFAEEALVAVEDVTLVDAAVDLRQAVALHVAYGTAWFGLHLRGRLAPGESVLVLAAAGGVGSAAVELARLHGCFVIAAAGGEEKTALCHTLAADAVIDYNAQDLYAEVMALTDGRGVDVVYDPVGGDYFDVARRLVAWEGRYLVIGFASGTIPAAALNHVLVKNYDVVGVHMGGYRQKDQTPFQRCYDELYAMLADARIHPPIDRVVGFDALPAALEDLAQRRSKGRWIFAPDA